MRASRLRSGAWVVALFESQADAERAIHELTEEGFPREAMGVALRDPAYRRGVVAPRATPSVQGETAGGSILGGVVGLLTRAEAVALPGVGPVIAGGAMVPSLTGPAAEGVLGALHGLGVPDGEARHLEAGLRRGAVLVTVDAGTRGETAREILRGAGGAPDSMADDELWRGSERRYRDDPSYHGPDRRLSHHR